MSVNANHQRAHHEACHAAVAMRVGLSVSFIDINVGFSKTGLGGVGCSLEYTEVPRGASHQATYNCVEKPTMAIVAGSVGDAIIENKTFDEAWSHQIGDQRSADELFGKAQVPPKRSLRRNLIRTACVAATEIIVEQKKFINHIVERLLAEGRLEKEAIEEDWKRYGCT